MNGYAMLVVRLCLSLVFLYSGLTKLLDITAGTAEVAALGLPAPQIMLALTVVAQLGGGLSVLMGWWSRIGAFVLLGFTVAATLLGHAFWQLSGAEFQHQLTTTLEHLAIVGGFLMLMLSGPGPISIDETLRK